MTTIRWMLAALLAVGTTEFVAAQDWPSRPMTMVVAFPAGGSDDVLGRIIATRLSELLGQPVNVENIAGGGGTEGTARVAKADPDGYRFALGTSATHAISQVLRKNPPYDASADFAPVALIAEQPFVLISRKDLPAGNLQAFTAHARANVSGLSYGSAGAGSATHLVCAMLDAASGIKGTHIAYNGGVPALRDLIAGKIDYFCPVVTIAIPQIANGSVKAIAVLSRDRSPVLPDIASAGEQGLTGFAASTWFGVFLPKGTPAPIVQRLNAAIVAAMETPAVQARLKEIGAAIVAPERRSPAYMTEFLGRENEKWVTAVAAAKIPVE
jgi:tripartite-type tricarboxylate transporter receptor subunit TctC